MYRENVNAGLPVGYQGQPSITAIPNTVPREMSQTEIAFNSADKSLVCLTEAVNRLEHKLAPALRPVGPTQPGQSDVRPKMDVPLAETVMSLATRTDLLASQINDLADRLGI